ncbi:porin PorA family protein [Gordonia sp. w5E2]|uniref:porin PorA family protein n=1 Tax=Gordonia TaxID=2053 RepID=UPI0006725EC3|nr:MULTISPECIES: porin PorA family protein [Gordonia]
MSKKRTLLTAILGLLGVVCLVVAALLPTVIRSNTALFPTNLDRTAVLAGQGTLIDRASFTTATPVATTADVPIEIITRNQSSPGATDDTAATTTTVTSRRSDVAGQAGVFGLDTLAGTIDRTTYKVASSPEPTLITAPATTPSNESSYAGTLFTFPIGTDKSDHTLYELRGHTPITMKYVNDTREINGVKTYHFRGEVTGVDTTQTHGVNQQTQITMPAFKWGIPGGATEPVTMKLFYSNTRDMWVEPTSGTTVDTHTTPHAYYARSADDSFKVDAINADLRFDDATLTALANDARDARQTLRTTFFWTPIALGIVGLLLLVLAAVVYLRRPRRTYDDPQSHGPTATEPPLVGSAN